MPEVGDQYKDDDGQLWTITDEIAYYEVEIDEDPATDEPYTTTTGQWPAETVAAKVGDQLTPVDDSSKEERGDKDEEHVCEDCGKTFDSQQGLAGHQPCGEADADADGA